MAPVDPGRWWDRAWKWTARFRAAASLGGKWDSFSASIPRHPGALSIKLTREISCFCSCKLKLGGLDEGIKKNNYIIKSNKFQQLRMVHGYKMV